VLLYSFQLQLMWSEADDCSLVATNVVSVAIIVVPKVALIAVLTVFDCEPLHLMFKQVFQIFQADRPFGSCRPWQPVRTTYKITSTTPFSWGACSYYHDARMAQRNV
jgi:hypothetical protein